MTDEPVPGWTASAVEFMTELVTSVQSVAITVGTPRETVFLRSGSCKSTCRRGWMPWRASAGIWQAICTKTPAVVPTASTVIAAASLTPAIAGNAAKLAITTTLLRIGPTLLQK